MNEEILFYLTSRGIGKKEAQTLIKNGYFQNIFRVI